MHPTDRINGCAGLRTALYSAKHIHPKDGAPA